MFFTLTEIILEFICGLYRFNNKNGALRLYGEPEELF